MTENAETGLCIGHIQLKIGILLCRTEIIAFAKIPIRMSTGLFKWEHGGPLTVHQTLKFYFYHYKPDIYSTI